MKITLYVLVAVLAALAGVGIYRTAIEPRVLHSEAAGGTIALAPAAPAAATARQESADIPHTLPDFTLTDLQGTPRSILGWPGKSMIVNFWATWCAPCRREIPLLKALQRERAHEGFQVVGVAVDFRDDVIKYAQEIGIDYPVLIGEQEGLDAVMLFGQGALGFPFTVFTDDQHRIVLFHLGEIEPPEAEVLLGAVRRVNRGELTIEAARVVAAKQLAQLEPAEA